MLVWLMIALHSSLEQSNAHTHTFGTHQTGEWDDEIIDIFTPRYVLEFGVIDTGVTLWSTRIYQQRNKLWSSSQ